MSTLAPEHTKAPTEPGDHDRFSHYVRKEALTAAMVEGVPAVAICGKHWLPTRDGQKFPVCPTCQENYEAMRPGAAT